MLKHLHLRVFKTAVNPNFQSAFMDYYNERNEFSTEFMSLDEWQAAANEKAGANCVWI